MSPFSVARPSLFRLLAGSRSRLEAARLTLQDMGQSAQSLAEADLTRLSAFGSWRALSAELRQRAAAR